MAAKSEDYLYELDDLTTLMNSLSNEQPVSKETGARPRKTKRTAKTKPEAANQGDIPSVSAALQLEKIKNENLKIQLEITRANLEMK